MTGCSFSPINVEGLPCPCPDELVCVENVCRRVIDAGQRDAAPPDATPRDAGAMDTGPADAGPTDAGADTGPVDMDAGPPDCPVGAFCETFESSNPGANGWRAIPDFARVNYVDPLDPDPTVVPHRGTGMLRVSTLTPGGVAEIEICPFEGFVCPSDTEPFDAGPVPDGGVASLPGITSGDIYMRAHVYVPSLLGDGRELVMGHASVIHIGTHRGVYIQERAIGFNIDFDRAAAYVGTSVGRIDPRPPEDETDDRPMFPRDRWVCVQVHVNIDPVSGSIATYLDGDSTPATERAGIDTLASLPYRHFGVGLGYTDNMDNGAVLYIDDVAFSRSPIACAE